MEAPEETTTLGPQEHEHIRVAKRKRTKRQRVLQSPFHFGIANSPTDGYTSGEKYDTTNNNLGHFSSPTCSTEVDGSTLEEEEQDMANCLILLAQGESKAPQKSSAVDEDVVDPKFNSKRYFEASTGTGNKVGYYLYECKTCGRTFPSFQALGGHRASHKKPNKVVAAEEKRHQFGASSSEDEESLVQFNKGNNNESSFFSLQLSNRNFYATSTIGNNNTKKHPKVHECSTCGAEFTSGQALGGHMRRHRAMPTGIPNMGLSLNPTTPESEEPVRPRNNVVSLDLDLNLPAPEDDHHHDRSKETQFPLSTKKQKQQEEQEEDRSQLVFSVPALVDCHY